MKELQIENISSILNHFYFLIYEHFSVKDMTIGLRSYPSIVFKNHQLRIQTIKPQNLRTSEVLRFFVYIKSPRHQDAKCKKLSDSVTR